MKKDMKIAAKSIWKYIVVYRDSVWGLRCAERITDAIFRRTGVRLPLVSDDFEEREHEILVGKTSRRESVEMRARYDRPNLRYDIRSVNGKLVCMGEGYLALERVAAAMERAILLDQAEDLEGEIASGDLRVEPEENMAERADGTDVRVLDWNLNAPGNSGEDQVASAEKVADVILRQLPDIISTNEFYDSESCAPYKRFYDVVFGELSPYYTVLKSPYDEGQPVEGLIGERERYGCLPEQIFVRKGSGIKPVLSGYRYTPQLITYHGYHWAIFERDKKQFLFTVGHYEDCRSDPLCAQAHMETIKYAQEKAGIVARLPKIITGDLFTHIGCDKGGYAVFTDAGYSDAQRNAEINCNGDITLSTFHKIGQYQPKWVSIDLIFCNALTRALKFKVITSQEALDVSDHCPVVADLKLE